jgi:hypothetical protein
LQNGSSGGRNRGVSTLSPTKSQRGDVINAENKYSLRALFISASAVMMMIILIIGFQGTASYGQYCKDLIGKWRYRFQHALGK